MKLKHSFMLGLLAGSALGGNAFAQQTTTTQAAPAQTLGEVIVTATRRSDTVHNIPLSITAVTPQDVERQGLKTAQDLVQSVTSLRISPASGGGVAGNVGNPDVAIRGIRSTTGSATTGIYVDDVPLQQRNVSGPAGGGAVLPTLFDLERVEVLKGPQGTLYGGSSEGGTLRFITPSPSFTKRSLFVRAEGSSVDQGDPSYEFGVAGGAPLVEDKVAVRLSAWYRRDGGYIDHVSQYTGAVLPGGKNTNSQEHGALHGSLALKPVERATVTLSYLYETNRYNDGDQYWENIPQYQTTFGQATGPNTPPASILTTIGPFNHFGPYKSGQNSNVGANFYTSDAQIKPLKSPHRNNVSIPSLTIDYAFDKMTFKSITSYAETKNSSTPDFSYVDTASRSVTPLEAPFNSKPSNGAYIPNLPLYSSKFNQDSQINSLSQEFRFASNDPESKLSWVGGLFYNFTDLSSFAKITANTGDLAAAAQLGIPSATGTPFAPLNGIGLIEPQSLNETQIAAYGEATYKVTDKLRVTAGVRFTRDEFNYQLALGGALFGFAPGVVRQSANGSVTESPITPKFGIQYVLDSNTNFYANAAKGFRPGGVNAAIPPSCAQSLLQVGYPNGAPTTYASDSLWSYEGGVKSRFFGGRANVNASLFYIDWQGVQTQITLTCGQSFTSAAAGAVSQGADFQGTFRLFEGMTATVNVAYTDAHYTKSVPGGLTGPLIASGDPIPFTPKWTANLTGEYRFKVMEKSAYIRADYSYLGESFQGSGPTTAGYLPDSYKLKPTNLINARAGVSFDKFDVSAFVTNLTESRDLLALNGMAAGPGRVSCTTVPACSTYFEYARGALDSTYRPRTIGVAVSYRY